jgi:hypothetical protein
VGRRRGERQRRKTSWDHSSAQYLHSYICIIKEAKLVTHTKNAKAKPSPSYSRAVTYETEGFVAGTIVMMLYWVRRAVWTLQPWRWRQHASPKSWLLPTSPDDALTETNIIRAVIYVVRYYSVFSVLQNYSRSEDNCSHLFWCEKSNPRGESLLCHTFQPGKRTPYLLGRNYPFTKNKLSPYSIREVTAARRHCS